MPRRVGRPLIEHPSRWLVALAVPVAMLVVAGASGQRQLVFPEGAALALGVVGLRLEAWRASPAALVVLLATAALGGVALVHAGGPRPAEEVAALAAVLAALHLARSRLTPTISAAVLPLVFHIGAWTFPAAVAVVAATLASVSWAAGPRRRPRPEAATLPPAAALAGFAVVAAWIALAGPGLGLPAPALAPPLFVATFEWLGRDDHPATVGVRQWLATVGAAGIGAGLAAAVEPAWVGGVAALGAVAAVLAVTATPHPPALAICLIPQITGDVHPARFVAAVALGAAVLSLAADLARRRLRPSPSAAPPLPGR